MPVVDTQETHSTELGAQSMDPEASSGTRSRDFGQQGRFVKKSSVQAVPNIGLTDTVLSVRIPIIEAEATLARIAVNHEALPQCHVQGELTRVEVLLKHAEGILKHQASDLEAPELFPGIAAVRNTLNRIDWTLLAVEEGGVANIEEALQIAAAAAKQSKKFTEDLLNRPRNKSAANVSEGSPSSKRARREVATSSGLISAQPSNTVILDLTKQ